MVTLRPRGPRWQYDIRFNWPDGSEFRERKNAPIASKSGAQRWAEQREQELIRAGKGAHEATPSVVTLADFWPRVVADHYRAERKKESTVSAAETIYKVHLGPLLGDKPLDQITTADVATLKGALAHRKPKTVNNVLSVLSRVLRCAVAWEVIPFVPCKLGLLRTPEGDRDWYELPDYRRLIDAARKLGTGPLVALLLAGSAGLRIGEIRALKWHDIDMPRRQVKISRGLWYTFENTPKGGRGRLVPLTPELHAALTAHRHLRDERVLCGDAWGRGKGDIGIQTVRTWFMQAQKRAGLEVKGGIHMLRHTFCSHLAAAGAPAKAIQELAGHANLATTQRYMHLAPGGRSEAMGLLAGFYGGLEKSEKKNTGTV
jgi:integrase